jgi:hypothetical protein
VDGELWKGADELLKAAVALRKEDGELPNAVVELLKAVIALPNFDFPRSDADH